MFKIRQIGYWASTALVSFALFAGGLAELAHLPVIDAGMTHLGYPTYFTTILGCWKLPGAQILLAPCLPRLKEWAYAGAFFTLSGAVASHILSGDRIFQFVAPLVFASCTLISWALRPQSRVLGRLSPLQTGEAKRPSFEGKVKPAR